MKHNLKIISLMVLLFLVAQFVGLYIVNSLVEKELPYNIERPKFEKGTSFIQIFLIIIIVTIASLILIRFNAIRLWKLWFFISIVFVLTISLSVFVDEKYALFIALAVSFFKIVKPNIIVHNISELFIYGGLAAVFVPVLSIISISILILLIAAYDAIAVWKTKHMVKLAKFQSKLKMFSGLMVPYGKNKVAVLGGGDIGFPLLFSGVILSEYGFVSLIIPVVVSLSLFLLLYFGKKNRFYPAMPFLGAGCFIGYGLMLLLLL